MVLDGAGEHTALVADLVGAHAHDTRMNGAGHAVLLLDVQAREDVGVDGGHLLEIARGGRVHDRADNELADSLGRNVRWIHVVEYLSDCGILSSR